MSATHYPGMKIFPLFLVLGLSIVTAQSETRPNIAFVFSDDHATQAISSYGCRLAEVAPTPNLDRIAEEGMRFTRCLVTNSILRRQTFPPQKFIVIILKRRHQASTGLKLARE